jgi:hypothetical protein
LRSSLERSPLGSFRRGDGKAVGKNLLLLSYCDGVLVAGRGAVSEPIREGAIEDFEGIVECLLLHSLKSEGLSLEEWPCGCTCET